MSRYLDPKSDVVFKKIFGSHPHLLKSFLNAVLPLIVIELPKFKPTTLKNKKLTVLWLRFLSEIGEQTKTVSADLLNVPEIKEAIRLAEESAYTRGELVAYQTYWDAVSTEKTLFEGKYAEGRAEGKAEGRMDALVEVIKKQLKRGVSLEMIAEDTGLTVEAVRAI